MQSTQRAPEDITNPVPREPHHAAVRATLKIILQSQPFRTSRQCQNLLSYIVDHSLNDDDASLRERILGIQVFGRAPDYDTSEDPVVRMRAADVRKRLAQFYQAIEYDPSVVHIELKPGSYRVTFHYERDGKEDHAARMAAETAAAPLEVDEAAAHTLIDPAVVEPRSPSHPRASRTWAVLLSLLVTLLLSVVGWRTWVEHSLTPQQRFWAPLIRGKQPVLLYVGANVAYRFTTDYMNRYQREHGLNVNGPEFFVDLPKGGVIQADDLVPVKDTFVSVEDLAAATLMVSLMRDWGQPFNLRSANDISIGDIRNTPSIFIGGFNNTWTLETTNDLPFSFRDGIRIQNKSNPAQRWVVNPDVHGGTTEDFALVSRLLNSNNTGGPVLEIGGIGSMGTQAAAEFVTSPDRMSELLKSAPPGWENKNIQVVLRIKAVGYAPVAVDVVGTSYW